MTEFLTAHWFDLVQTIGIVSALLIAVSAVRDVRRSGGAITYLELVRQHREIWQWYADDPELAQLFKPRARKRLGPNEHEEEFIRAVLIHMAACFRLGNQAGMPPLDELRDDARELFRHDTMRAGWEANRHLYGRDFVRFVDALIEP